MCGIACIIASDSPRHGPALGRMIASIRHRGPDASGTHFFENCALGHARLSILDIAGSPQPMISRHGRHGLVFNGEIYGFRDLRNALADFPFRTQGDTEVLLGLYEKFGPEMASHLPGMFAFAIWDDACQRLYCARDRFGEKPLYYATGKGGELVVASEIKAIRASGLVEPTICKESLAAYLRRGFVPADRTIFREIHVLPPAHCLVAENGAVSVRRYWSLPQGEDLIGPAKAAERFKALMEQSVARQLVADVPVGAFLSGGIDSSTIVAVAARLHPGIKTFSFGYGKISELPYAREIANRYGTDHIEEHDEAADLPGMLRQMQSIFDEPHADTANIPTFLLSKLARRHVTVALAGEGGDELLGGYAFWYRPLFHMEIQRNWPRAAAAMVHAAGSILGRLGLRPPRLLAEAREGLFLKKHYRNALEGHYARNGYLPESAARDLGIDPPEPMPPAPRDLRAGSMADVMRADLLDYLPGDILVKTDRASMANSLEIRAPFLDVDLASFCITLPTRLKISRSEDKVTLRRAYASAWTPSIRARSKQGFGAPVSEWMERESVRALAADIAGSPSHPIFDHLAKGPVTAGLLRADYPAWILLNLALWLEETRTDPPGTPPAT